MEKEVFEIKYKLYELLLVSMVEWKRGEKIARQMNQRLAEYQRSVIQ